MLEAGMAWVAPACQVLMLVSCRITGWALTVRKQSPRPACRTQAITLTIPHSWLDVLPLH
jgi:hypothetical protein